MKYIDPTTYFERRFGERTVLKQWKTDHRGNKLLLMVCDAGHYAWVRLSHINAGVGGSCRTCHCTRIATKHGEAGVDRKSMTPIYKKWVDMKTRVAHDESYIKRGIKVCDRWQSFENFKDDMGDPPDTRMELDRKDGTQGYFPENCCWSTHAQNNKNRTNLRMVSFDGKTMCIADWEKYLNVTPDTLRKKLRFDRPLENIMTECGYVSTNVLEEFV